MFNAATSPTYKTALSVSIFHKHIDVFDYLIAHGAQVSNPNRRIKCEVGRNMFFTRSMTGLACLASNHYAVTRLLPRETDDILVITTTPAKIANREWKFCYLPQDFLAMPILNGYVCLSLFIYYAIVSAKKSLLNKIAGSVKRDIAEKLNLSSASFQEYLCGTKLDPIKAAKAKEAISHLYNLRLVNEEMRDELLETVWFVTDHEMKSDLGFTDLPEPLQQTYQDIAQRDIAQLFAEFTSFLYPGVPAIQTNNPLFRKEEYRQSKEEIEQLQNPLNLRTFLDLGDAEIKKQLGLCIDEMDGNPAAELLAQMLFLCNPSKEQESEKEKEKESDEQLTSQSLLSHAQIQKGLRLLIELYSISPENRLKLSISRHQHELLAQMRNHTETVESALMEQNKILIGAVQSLTEQIKLLTVSFSQLNDEHRTMKKQLEGISEEKLPEVQRAASHKFF